MSAFSIAPDPDLRVERVLGNGDQQVVVEVTVQAKTGTCPRCGTASGHVHSVYLRTLRDVPWQGHPVLVQAWVRRFFCDVPTCPQTIFCERPSWAPAHKRRTPAFTESLRDLGWATNAETAAKTANRLGLPTSADTVLRCLRDAPEPKIQDASVIGIDDWALRKGVCYATLIVDLKSHQVLDLFEGRDAQGIAAWLRDHPGVEIVSRDRAGAYARGVREGAPTARQVADRFHLLENLSEGLYSWLKGHPAPQTSPLAASAPAASESAPPSAKRPEPLCPGDARRAQRWQTARALREQGQSISAIARSMGLERATVRGYLQCTEPPQRPRRPGVHLVSWQSVLEELYAEGARTGVTLWHAARAKGYPGSRSTAYQWLHQTHPEACATKGEDKVAVASAGVTLTAREWTRACLTAWPKLPRHWTDPISERLSTDPEFRAVWSLVRHFHALVHFRRPQAMDAWQRIARQSGIGFLGRFADGLDKDRDAVLAGCSEPWSQGVVEGQNTRTKFLKRLMYGRANFDLLRLRVLHAS